MSAHSLDSKRRSHEIEQLTRLGFAFSKRAPNDEYMVLDDTQVNHEIEPTIEINTLEELVELFNQVGPLILLTGPVTSQPNIEIYNNYRE